MAKPLGSAVPSSAVARLLDPGSARDAISPSPPRLVSSRPVVAIPAEPPAQPPIKREFVLTPASDAVLRRAVSLSQPAVGGSLTQSHFLRALLQVIAHAMPEVERLAAQLGPMKRPSNSRAEEAKREAFEHKLTTILFEALHSALFME